MITQAHYHERILPVQPHQCCESGIIIPDPESEYKNVSVSDPGFLVLQKNRDTKLNQILSFDHFSDFFRYVGFKKGHL
jgi:hypothetical protein